MEENMKRGSEIGGVALLACMLAGLLLGMLSGATQLGGILGMGIGSLTMSGILFYHRAR
ncbi:MAG: hypothetical protein HRT71_02830 [Flavobacteriales bacterium]|nr:hypothetical protein [Flavobacteriales bacterium]